MRYQRLIAVACSAALVVTACGGDDDDDATEPDATEAESVSTDAEPATSDAEPATSDAEPAATAAPNSQVSPATAAPAAGECTEPTGELNVATLIEVQGFDTRSGGSVGIAGGSERTAFFDTLVTYNTQTLEWEPMVAESLVPNDDYSEWTLTLRPDITFGNGNPLTTADVEANVVRHVAEDSRSQAKAQALLIEEMEIVDELTMVFHLTGPWGGFPYLLGTAVGMVADHTVFDERGAEAFALDPTGAGVGPFELERYSPGEELVFTAKDDYWGGPVCVETLRFVNVASEDTRRDAFLNGEFDAAAFQTMPVWQTLREEGFEPHTFEIYGNESVLISHKEGRPGADVRVRQAISAALDLQVIDERMTGGVGLPGSALTDENSPLYTGAEGPQYDPERAVALLEEAKADGYSGDITLKCHNTPQLVEWAIAVEGLLEAVGFNVTLDNDRALVDHVTGVYYTGDFEIACLAISFNPAAAWSTASVFMLPTPVQQERIGYTSEAMVAAVDELQRAFTTEELAAAVDKIQAIWNEEIPMAVTNHSERGVVWQDDVTGIEFSTDANARYENVVRTG